MIFTESRALLCKQKNTSSIKDKWELLTMIIDNLSTEENKKIYKKLGDFYDIPQSIKPQYFMKSYTFLQSLPATVNCESIVDDMKTKSPEMMEWLDEDFVVDVLLKNINVNFAVHSNNMDENGRIVAAFMLLCKEEAVATRRYEKLLGPLLDRNLPLWNNIHVQDNTKEILESLIDLIHNYNLSKKMHLPIKCYQNILLKLETSLSLEKDYDVLTGWKIGVEFAKLIDKYKYLLYTDDYEANSFYSLFDYPEMHVKMAPMFAEVTLKLLKSHIDLLSESVITAFAETYERIFDNLLRSYTVGIYEYFEFVKCMLEISDEKYVHLFAYKVLKNQVREFEGEVSNLKEVRKLLLSHPWDELKVQYHQVFYD